MSHSSELFNRACAVIPGGVNSPVRAFKQVASQPLFISKAKGACVYDADGREFIDYVGSWGPMVLGHAAEIIENAAISALKAGASFGAPTELEVRMAEFLCANLPGIEKIRMVNSGTEATMSALRLARGFTGRDVLIKFNGHYHGHADSLLVAAGSGVATFGIAGSPGVPKATAELTLSLEFNDIELFKNTLKQVGADRVAAVIVEPVAGNMGLVPPVPGFLQALREITAANGIVLIFDEVMTGFRVAFGGAAERFGITPDLATYGKVIGGGFPVGAFGGRRDIMSQLAPEGPVYQAGTLSGNPVAMAAGLAVLEFLKRENPFPLLEERSRMLAGGLADAAKSAGIPFVSDSIGGMFGFFFSAAPVRNFTEAKASDVPRFQQFFHEMLNRGIYLAPSAFEAGFVSTAHTPELIARTLDAARESFAAL